MEVGIKTFYVIGEAAPCFTMTQSWLLLLLLSQVYGQAESASLPIIQVLGE
jgi:hypothetical protein